MFIIKVQFDRPDFAPGEVVSGTVIVESKKPVKASKLRAYLYGKSSTKWREDKQKAGVKLDSHLHPHLAIIHRLATYSDKTEYVNLFQDLWNEDMDTNEFPAGISKLRFAFTLPELCPPSFKGKYGKVKYHLKTLLCNSKGSFNEEHICPVIVKQKVPHDADKKYKPEEFKLSKNIGAPLMRNGIVEVGVSYPQMPYLPCSSVPITLKIKNDSSKAVIALHFKMIRFVYFTATHNTLTHSKSQSSVIMRHAEKINVQAGKEETIVHNLKLPYFVPQFDCGNIEIIYNLKVAVETSATFGNFLESANRYLRVIEQPCSEE